MGAVLFTAEFPATGTVMPAEFWHRNLVAGTLYEHDTDTVFLRSDAERAQAIMPVLFLSFLHFF